MRPWTKISIYMLSSTVHRWFSVPNCIKVCKFYSNKYSPLKRATLLKREYLTVQLSSKVTLQRIHVWNMLVQTWNFMIKLQQDFKTATPFFAGCKTWLECVRNMYRMHQECILSCSNVTWELSSLLYLCYIYSLVTATVFKLLGFQEPMK